MDKIVLGARLVLAAVFAVSAVAKLADSKGSRHSLRDFRVPPVLVPAAAIVLPLIELSVAMALLSASVAVGGAVAALTLLLLFIGAMAVSLAAGRRPDCHCFGQLHSTPVSGASIARNVLLAGLAAIILFAGPETVGPSAIAWVVTLSAFERAAVIAGIVIIALLGWNSVLLARLLRQQTQATVRTETSVLPAPQPSSVSAATALVVPEVAGHAVGTPAPDFALPTLRGDTLTLKQLRQLDRPIVLFFSDPGCGPCTAMLPDIGQWQRQRETDMTLVVISRGERAENDDRAREAGLTWLLLQNDREIANAYGVFGTPSAVRINVDGTIATRLAQGEVEIRDLITRTAVSGTTLAPSGSNAPAVAAVSSPAEPSTPEAGDNPPAALTADSKPVKNDCVEDELMSDGTVVLYNGCRNQVLTLNGTAALIWEYCDGEHDAAGIAAILNDLFPDAKTAEGDVTRLLQSLLDAGMILPEKTAAAAATAAAAPPRS